MPQPNLMQLFEKALRKWVPHIKRQTYAKEVTLTLSSEGLGVSVSWPKTSSSPAGSHFIVLTKKEVFGVSTSTPLQRTRPLKPVCAFRDQIIRTVLQARGVM
jgi:hypothetical protein